MKIWRKLSQIGAVPFRGSVYLLPDNEEHYEYCQWLVSEVVGRGGDGAFVRVEGIEFMKENELVALFAHHREKDYRLLEDGVETLERGIDNLKKGGGLENKKKLIEDFKRLRKDFEVIRKVDFFLSKKGTLLETRIKTIHNEIKTLLTEEIKKPEKLISQKDRKDYQGRVWVTRKRPYVDRIASAWLIRKFIDPNARYKFIAEDAISPSEQGEVTFDMSRGEFTHQGDLCTFEVLIKIFGLKDKALRKMADIVHEIDLKDEKHQAPEAKGVEEILKGLRKTVTDDKEILEKGLALFEMLYASKTQ
ncbi:MAG: chromate resistance protein ChrB domain-containing protein [Pseudomonadota bacterium]